MLKEFCDICGKEVKIKRKDYMWWDDVVWRKLTVCEYCQRAIVSKSLELRKED